MPVNKILVVDDRNDIRQLLAMTLEEDYEVLQAGNGAEALQLAREEKPFAVLLDIMLPGRLDGLDVLGAIKSDPRLKDIAVGMVTARNRPADLALGEKLGADGFFIKPFSPMQLLSWLRQREGHAVAMRSSA
jgi:CheY-like chemotaxis protein